MATWSQTVALASQAVKPDGRAAARGPLLPLKPGEGRAIGSLYQSRIRPLIPFAIRGVLWDQGESGTAIGGVDQVTLMATLIRSWRAEWGRGDFPFLYVQKPSGGGCALDPANPVTVRAEPYVKPPKDPPSQADFRERHLRIRQNPNTAMVTASDLGSGIHPACKSGYGERAARVALGFVYGRPVEIYGPIYRSHAAEGSRVRIQFDHVGQGLAVPKSTASNAAPVGLTGFALAGTNRVFHWAQAVIEDDTVVVSCDQVPEPVAIRYAWAERHPWANLFNRDGLPALPFRTDNWSPRPDVASRPRPALSGLGD
jgi:sialate O-acetylesterase